MPPQDLTHLLKEKFGFDQFRLSQEEVCRSVVNGEDALLVMPTGAGKSLCYQLPGIARGGTTVVISPLIALIDDQNHKLKSRGFRSQAIHSGVDRELARAACRDYLQGALDFLFIAPERLAVPGFPEMLQKKIPALIAIDEAHCISQWGHDFRPEYRKLGERVRGLRPAPILALTATATPRVQDDIIAQLGIPQAKRLIQGFRRDNIAIQIHEVSKTSRIDACLKILESQSGPPAIIYAQTRKSAEEIAQALSKKYSAECYHAGLSSETRERVQTRFIESKVQVMVATIAFGMGIDKADIRTIIHAGLPGSVEGYYQEIGRAGRDGLPSQAILLYSFADRKMHDFFLAKDYPELHFLQSIDRLLTLEPRPQSEIFSLLKKKIKMDSEVFEKSLEKMWIHGGVMIDAEENIKLGAISPAVWQTNYTLQREFKQQALQQIGNFVNSMDCRMIYFLKHFGDKKDSHAPCGICDRCRPQSALAVNTRRPLNAEERGKISLMLADLDDRGTLAAGRLFESLKEAYPQVTRSEFEKLLLLLYQENWLTITEETFEKGGEKIAYRKIKTTSRGEKAQAADLAELEISVSLFTPTQTPSRKKKAPKAEPPANWDQNAEASFEKLRAWRLAQAKQQALPAFRIVSDRVLKALIVKKLQDSQEVMQVKGMGPKLCEKYGAEILRCLKS